MKPPSGRPAVLGGVAAFSEKIGIIRPTKPTSIRRILKAVSGVILRGQYVGADSKKRFEHELAQRLGLETRRVVAVTSGTDALILLLRGAKVGADGRAEVILPSFTYHATVQAILRCGLEPVFADIDPETLTLDPKRTEELITQRTGAVLPVDVFGNPPAIDAFERISADHRVKLIFDSAGSLGATYKGKPIGHFGDGAVVSFSFGKIVQTFGHGGLLIADQSLIDVLHQDPQGLLEASQMYEVNAIMGDDNLSSFDQHLARRQEAARVYRSGLATIDGLSFQRTTHDAVVSPTHFPVVVDPELFGLDRDELKWALAAEGIAAKEYFPAQHRKFVGHRQGDLSCTDHIAGRVLCLPVWSDIDATTVQTVLMAVRRISRHAATIADFFRRREATVRSFIGPKPDLSPIERQLLFERFPDLRAMLSQGTVIPPEIDIHPTNVCNNRCRMCIGHIGAEKKKQRVSMQPEEIRRILKQLVAYNAECKSRGLGTVRVVRFTGHDGEPLNNPATLVGMREASRLGFETALVTNGTLLDQDAREVILGAKYVYVSLYGGSQKSYQAVTGNEHGFSTVMENLRETVRLKRERGSDLLINVGFLIQPENCTEVFEIAKTLRKIGVSNVRFRMAMEDEAGALTREALEKCFLEMRRAEAELSTNRFGVVIMYGEEEVKGLKKGTFQRCFAYPLIAVVGPDQNLYPCTHRSYARAAHFGSLRSTSLCELWDGPRKRSLMRRLIPERHCPICPPQAGRVNAFLDVLSRQAAADPGFLSWLEAWAGREAFRMSAMEPAVINLADFDVRDSAAIHSIRRQIKDRYQAVRPQLVYSPDAIQLHSLTLPCGVKANIGYVKNRPPYRAGEDRLTLKIRHKRAEYLLLFRGRPYTDLHLVLANEKILQADPPDTDRLEMGLLMARILGKESEIFCNRVAPTSDDFHYQIIRSGYLTIWDADLSKWPAAVVELRGEDPLLLSRAIGEKVRWFMGQTEMERNIDADIYLKYDGTNFRCLLIPRRSGNTYPTNRMGNQDLFSTVGSLEMGGFFISCKTDEGFAMMAGEDGGAIYEEALHQLSFAPSSAVAEALSTNAPTQPDGHAGGPLPEFNQVLHVAVTSTEREDP